MDLSRLSRVLAKFLASVPKLRHVTYRDVEPGYVERRGLRRHAGVMALWALGVGAVISGDFAGWNEGLLEGGLGGMLIATLVAAVMFAGFCFCVAEMSSAMPHAGAGYAYARMALGPWGGLIAGLSASAQFILLPAILVIAIGYYADGIADRLWGIGGREPAWWAAFYVAVVALHVRGAAFAMRAAFVLACLAVGILTMFLFGSIPHLSWDWALAITPRAGESEFLPNGPAGIVWALPFAIWFFLAVEQVPLAAEETVEAGRSVPKGLLRALLTLAITAFVVLLVNASIAPGARAVGASYQPMALGFRTILGPHVDDMVMHTIMLAGLITGFHALMFACGRNIFALSRAGYIPSPLSLTHATYQTPHLALITGAALGYAAALAIHVFGPGSLAVKPLLYMAVFGAIISCALQCLSFILLRRNLPTLERPFRSPLGLPGAGVALALFLLVLALLVADPEFRFGAIGIVIWYALGLAYFALYGRKTLVRSPEEEQALRETGGDTPQAQPEPAPSEAPADISAESTPA